MVIFSAIIFICWEVQTMKSNNILEILKGKNITIPYILIKNMDELKISYKEMIFLSYLIL